MAALSLGSATEEQDVPLLDLAPGTTFTLSRIDEEAGEDSCTLQLLWARGLMPGTQLTRMLNPRDGIALRRGDRRIVISRRIAGLLWGSVNPHPSTDEPKPVVDDAAMN